MTVSRQVKFQAYYKHQLEEIRKQVAVYGDYGHITAYKGNTTDMRARKRIRALAREVARLAMKELSDERDPAAKETDEETR